MAELADMLRIDLSTISTNIQEFFKQVAKPKYQKVLRDPNPLRRILLCKEDKESLIKSKIRALIQLYMMVNTLTDEELMVLDEFRAEREDDMMDTQDANRLAQLQDELFL